MSQYRIILTIMLSSYLYISIQGSSLRMKLIGLLLTVVNALIFWR